VHPGVAHVNIMAVVPFSFETCFRKRPLPTREAAWTQS
jgi:hypothetical protein